jgi:hypothetical protein
MMKLPFLFYLFIALFFGISIAYIDTGPHWDDTGMTVLMILSASLFCGVLSSRKTWLTALAIGIRIPAVNLLLSHNFGSLVALVPAFIGAYVGKFINRNIVNHSNY